MAILDSKPIVHLLKSMSVRGTARAELLGAAAREIRRAGPPYTSVYLYMLHGSELVLEAYDGRDTHHTRITVGTGVCGTAVETGRDQNIGDVREVKNYLACNLMTRSELVILIRKAGRILGQIDVDSDEPNPFTPDEVAAVRSVAETLSAVL
jgi:GAF domain-containing protein